MKKKMLLLLSGLCLVFAFAAKAQTGPCLTPKVTYTAGYHPLSSVAGDFNGDGHTDLAVSANGIDSVSIFLNDGTGAFANPVNYQVGSQPETIITSDFNNDGKLDVAIANNMSSDVSVLLGDGTGAFSAPANFLAGNYPRGLTSADFDGDGNTDLAVANYFMDSLSVLMGSGAGSFSAPIRYATDNFGFRIASGDLNNDGKPDIALTYHFTDSLVSVLLNNGDGTFAAALNDTIPIPSSILIYDFNGDGYNDLAVGSPGDVNILLGNGTGTFTSSVAYTIGGDSPFGMGIADLNNDGHMDIATANTGSNNMSVLMGDGAGALSAPVHFDVGIQPYSVAPGDFNGDGKTDISTANFYSYPSFYPSNVSVLFYFSPSSLALSPSSMVLCPGHSATITAFGASTYTWSTGATTADIAVSPTVATTYSVTGTNDQGCSATQTITIDINDTAAAPILGIVANDTSLCLGQSVTLVASGAGSYLWGDATSGIYLTDTPVSSTVYSVIGTAANGCTATQTISIFVDSSLVVPAISISISDSSICPGESVNITASGASTYTWSTGVQDSSITQVVTIDTAYVVVATGANGCSAFKSIGVLLDIPVISIAASSTMACVGQSAMLTAFGASTYTWSTGSGSAIVSVTPTVTTIYSVTGSSVGGCLGTQSITISGNDSLLPPVVSISAQDSSICYGYTAWLTASGADYYNWGYGNTVDSVLVPNIDSTTTFSVTGFLSNGCQSSATLQIDLAPAPDVIISGPSSICPGTSALLTASGADTYTWSTGAYTSSLTLNPYSSTSSYDVSYSTMGTGSNGCKAYAETTLHVFAAMSISTPDSSIVCAGSSINLYTLNANSYLWSTGDTTSFINVIPPVTSVYSIALADTNGCNRVLSITVVVDTTCADVWPGDANSDGVVDNLDFLELGLHISQTGPARQDSIVDWAPHKASNWSGTITGGKDLNHSDCNGDGIIGQSDTLEIYNFYSYTHAFKPSVESASESILSVSMDQTVVQQGKWGTASVYMGSVTQPVTNVNGTAFTISFDPALIQRDSIYIEYPASFLNQGQNLRFAKQDTLGFLFAATTHTNNMNVNGYGKIAIIHYKINPALMGGAELSFNLQQAFISNAGGSISAVTSGSSGTTAVGAATSVEEMDAGILTAIYPNPATDLLNISSSEELSIVELRDLTGQLAMSSCVSGKQCKLDLRAVSQGVYVISVYSSGRVIRHKKIVVQR